MYEGKKKQSASFEAKNSCFDSGAKEYTAIKDTWAAVCKTAKNKPLGKFANEKAKRVSDYFFHALHVQLIRNIIGLEGDIEILIRNIIWSS